MLKALQLKTKMLLMLMVPMLLILGGMSLYSYYSSRSMLNAQIEQTVSHLVDSNSNDIYSSLKEKEVMVSVVSQVLGNQQLTQAQEIDFLRQIKASGVGIQSAYTGYEDKTCADSQGVTQKEKPQGYDPRSRDWYKVAQSKDGVSYTNIYESTDKRLSVGVVKKIIKDNRFIGVAGIGMDIQPIHTLAKEVEIGKTGYAAILDAKGNFVYHPNYGLKDNISNVEDGSLSQYGKIFMEGKTSVQTGVVGGTETIMASSPIGDTGWTFVIFVPKAEMLEQVNVLALHSLISTIGALLLLGAIILAFTLTIVRRIKAVEDMAEKVANGDLTVDSKGVVNNGDEIDKLMVSFIRMASHLRDLISHVHLLANQVADSAERFNETSKQSAEASCSVADSVVNVTQGSEAQTKAFNEVSTVVEEMAANIQSVAGTTNGMARIVENANAATDAGQNYIDNAVIQMNSMLAAAGNAKDASSKLQISSKQIGEIVALISNIAGQTNLLALNAAIEAARAGEQGRGFAVVADEVRKLAEQSERAAQEITGLIQSNHINIDNVVESIETAISNVDQSVNVVNSAGEGFKQISHFVKEVVNQVAVISKSLEQLSSGSQRIVLSVNEVEKDCQNATGELQNVSAAVQQQSAAMEEITTNCGLLTKLAGQLKEQVNRFKM